MRTTSSGFLIVICLAFIIGLVGCQREGTGEKAGKKIDKAAESTGQKIERAGEVVVEKTERAGETLAEKAERAGEYMDDAAITAKIKTDIMRDPLLKVAQIEVTTTNGVVKLSGTVDSQQSIDRAMEIARSVKDVKSVDNALVRK